MLPVGHGGGATSLAGGGVAIMSSLSSGLSLACKAALSCSSLDWVGEAILSASDLGWVGEATPLASGLAWVGEATLSASGVNVAGRLFTHKGYSLPPKNSLGEPSLELVQKGLELFLVLPDLLVLGYSMSATFKVGLVFCQGLESEADTV